MELEKISSITGNDNLLFAKNNPDNITVITVTELSNLQSKWLSYKYKYDSPLKIHNRVKSLLINSIKTCCVITADVIRDCLKERNWNEVSVDTISAHRIFQVFFESSDDPDNSDIDHVITVCDDFVFQSFYGKYEIKKENIPKQRILRAILSKNPYEDLWKLCVSPETKTGYLRFLAYK